MLGYLKTAYDARCDRRLGIRTAIDMRPADTSQHHDALKSISTSYPLLARYIRMLRPEPSDVVYDIGCGTGRPLCLFARERVARCIGIEMDPILAETARRNATSLIGRRSEIAVIVGDAAAANYVGGTIFCLYNPFGPKTLAAVLAQIRQDVEANPRPVRFCYAVPEAERIFSASGWLTRYRTVRPLLHPTGIASFWRN